MTDHNALVHLQKARDLPGHLYRWALQIQEIDPLIVYRKGKINTNADALSRRYHDELGVTHWTPEEEFDLQGFSLTPVDGATRYSSMVELVPEDPVRVGQLITKINKFTDHQFTHHTYYKDNGKI